MRRINEWIETAIERAVQSDAMLELHFRAQRAVPEHLRNKDAWSGVFSDLYRHSREAWRDLMLAALTDPESKRMPEIRKAVYERHLKDGISVMGYISNTEYGWPVKLEEEFRAELRAAYGIRDEEE